MKRSLLAAVMLSLLLCAGCGAETQPVETEPMETAGTQPTAETSGEQLTERDILDIFQGYAYADPAERVVIDCVVVPDSAYGILGVVQYTTEDYDGCMFDFLTKGVPLSAGVGALPADTDSLEYLGGDTISCQLVNADGSINTYKVSFYRSDIEYGFQVVSE